METTVEDIFEPKVTSSDPNERKLARRLRIQRRLLAADKERSEEDEQLDDALEKNVVAKQVESSIVKLLQLLQDGKELATNVRVAAIKSEIDRRKAVLKDRDDRNRKLQEESEKATEKFQEISEKWELIDSYKDPLAIHEETEDQKKKCMDLLSKKDKVIDDLRSELKMADDTFILDLDRQEEDINILVDRIDKQITFMRRAYRAEIGLLEKAIDVDRRDLIRTQNTKWEKLLEEKEKLELNYLDKRYKVIDDYEKAIDNMTVSQQEILRETKVRLSKEVNAMQLELDKLKSICKLNTEKFNYNFQLLKKRDEENQIIKAQQKRTIIKLQDALSKSKKKRYKVESQMSDEIKRLKNDLKTLYNRIDQAEKRANSIAACNENKYFQLWDFNKKKADEIIKKVMKADRVICEQQLGLNWFPPRVLSYDKESLPSYKKGAEVVKADSEKTVVAKGPPHTRALDFKNEATKNDFFKHILGRLVECSSFLMEEKVSSMIIGNSGEKMSLVGLENVFSGLGIRQEKDVELLVKYFIPYAECPICSKMGARAKKPDAIKSELPLTDSDPSSRSSDKSDSEALEKLVINDTLIEANNVATKEFSSTPKGQIRKAETADKTGLDVQAAQLTDENGSGNICTFPNHKLTIDRVYVLKGLRDFMEDFHIENTLIKENSLDAIVEKKTVNIARFITEKDVSTFWQKYRQIISKEKESAWDTLLFGMRSYYTSLQERHKLIEEIKKLQKSNMDLRNLLQNYIKPPLEKNFQSQVETAADTETKL